MQRFSKTRLLTLGLAVILMAFAVSAMAVPGNWTPQMAKPQHQTGHNAVTTGPTDKRAPGQGQIPKLNSDSAPPAFKAIQQGMKTMGIKPWELPKVPLKRPAYKMLVDSALKAGVPVDKATQNNPKSLCDYYGGWYAGPTWTSNTNGTSMVWGAGMNIYFASADDPTHPLEVAWGDFPTRIYYQGNTAIVMCLFGVYAFDVTNPTQPAFIGYDYAGMLYGFTAFGMTGDGQYIVGLMEGDFIVVWDSAFNYITSFDLESIYPAYPWVANSPDLSDMVIPATPGDVLIITDQWNQFIHFVYLGDLICSTPQYLGYIDDFFAFGFDYACGQVMYQAPYLYTVYEPWWYYHPLIYGACPDNLYWINEFKVPDISNPAVFISVKAWSANNGGNDVVAIRPGGNGNVALGLYNTKAALWGPQLNTLEDFAIMGSYGFDGWCAANPPDWEFFSTDMGWPPTGMTTGLTANWAGGARFFSTTPMAETGHYLTGDWAYNAQAVGTTIYCPEFADGMAILDGSDAVYPYVQSWLLPTSGLPYIGLVGTDGSTACVAADYDTNLTKVFAADVSDPSAPSYLSSASSAFDITSGTGYGTQIESLMYSGGICWIGTDTHVVGVSFANPSAPSVIAAFALQAGSTGAYGMSTFTLPAFPQSTLMAVAAGGNIEVYDVTSPVQFAGCPTPYFYVGAIATPGGGNATDVFQTGSYLIYNDTINSVVGSIGLTANIASACVAGEVTMAAGSTLSTAVIGTPHYIAYAGSVGGYIVAAVASQTSYTITTIDISNPAALAFLNPTPQVVNVYGWGLTGLFYSNGAVYYSTGYTGLLNYFLEPGFAPPVVNSVTVSPAVGTQISGTVTLTANVTAADSAVTEVDFYFGGNLVAEVPTNVPAGTTANVTYSWDTSEWTFYPCGTYAIVAEAFDAGCNSDMASTGGSYNIDLAPEVYFSNWNPAMPGGGVCVNPGTWVICGPTFTFTATGSDGACNIPLGISQMSLYVDGAFVTYINNPLPGGGLGVWDITLNTTTLTDGQHTVTVTATDTQGLTGTATSAPFIVHNNGPVTTVVAPVAGDVVGGTDVRVAATTTSMGSMLETDKVVFVLDVGTPQQVTLGTATTADADGEFAIVWDSTSTGTNTPYGDHTITATGWDGLGTICPASSVSPLVSFRLVAYMPMTVTATATPSTGTAPLNVLVTTTATGGTPPYTYSIDFGDGTTPGASASASHTYSTAGTYNVVATVTDSTSTSVSSTPVQVVVSVTPPVITLVKKKHHRPFRLQVFGSNFQPGLTATIAGTAVTYSYKSSAKIVLKNHIKSLCPKGVAVPIVITNPDGGVSSSFTYTR